MMILFNITEENKQFRKKNSEYDEMFYSLLDKLNKGLKEEDKAVFKVDEKTLYLGSNIKANNETFIGMCDAYKFFIAKSLF